MSELKTSLKIGSARWVLTGVGGGAGVAVGIAAIRALTARPEFLPQLVNGGFLGFAAVMVGMIVASNKADRFMAAHERQIVAQEQLAANVGALVAKDDQRAREQDLLLSHLARQTDALHLQGGEILEEIAQLRRERGGN